jgi:hypothetical protein
LDLSNRYHLDFDAGAFVSAATGLPVAAFDGSSLLAFKTIVPGVGLTGGLASAEQAVAMNADGTFANSRKWLDIEGLGNPAGTPAELDLVSADFALAVKDYLTTAATSDGIQINDMNIAVRNFAPGDVIYIDNQSAVANNLAKLIFIDNGQLNGQPLPVRIQFSKRADSAVGLGGFIDIYKNSATAQFESLPEFISYLNNPPVSPVISA